MRRARPGWLGYAVAQASVNQSISPRPTPAYAHALRTVPTSLSHTPWLARQAVLGDDCALTHHPPNAAPGRARGSLLRQMRSRPASAIGPGCPLPPRTNTTFQRDYRSERLCEFWRSHLGPAVSSLAQGPASCFETVPHAANPGRSCDRDATGTRQGLRVLSSLTPAWPACEGYKGGYQACFWAFCSLLLPSEALRGAAGGWAALTLALVITNTATSEHGGCEGVWCACSQKMHNCTLSASEASKFTLACITIGRLCLSRVPSSHPTPYARAAQCRFYTCFMLF